MDCFDILPSMTNHRWEALGATGQPMAIERWFADSVDLPGRAFDQSASPRDPRGSPEPPVRLQLTQGERRDPSGDLVRRAKYQNTFYLLNKNKTI